TKNQKPRTKNQIPSTNDVLVLGIWFLILDTSGLRLDARLIHLSSRHRRDEAVLFRYFPQSPAIATGRRRLWKIVAFSKLTLMSALTNSSEKRRLRGTWV